ncbi:MAG: TonB-dependent receptor [Bacteroidales bacterium]|nr:TonB-dependent receptor [Bacteroidales bacterium]
MKRTESLVALCIFIFQLQAVSQTGINDTIAASYELGEVQVFTSAGNETTDLDELAASQHESSAFTISRLPGIHLVNYGNRAESSISIRGYDIRSIPVFIDGIPVYAPYDGYLDLDNLIITNTSSISVSRGFIPGGLAANAMGGAVNIVTAKPSEKLELKIDLGAGSGKRKISKLQIGSNLGKIYITGAVSGISQDFYPLSSGFDTTGILGSEDGTFRDNSYFNKFNSNLKIGYKPNNFDEYSVNYLYHKSDKGTPPYAGKDDQQRERFWQWPYWKKNSFYFIGNKRTGDNSSLKVRAYYDDFSNKLSSYDDNSYTSQTRRYAFNSYYNDYAVGTNAGFTVDAPRNNLIRLNAQVKNDHHSEYNDGEPVRRFSDITYFLGAENAYSFNNVFKLIGSLGYIRRTGIMAEDYNPADSGISEMSTSAAGGPTMQFAMVWSPGNHELQLGIYRKIRMATMKERYSYRAGSGIPNPWLQPEKSTQGEFSYKFNLEGNLDLEAAFFLAYLEDAIVAQYDTTTDLTQAVNKDRAANYGFEVSGNYRISNTVNIGINYTYLKMNNLSDPGVYFIHIPENEFRILLDIHPIKPFKITTEYLFMDERYSTTYGTTAPAFSLLNLHFSYQLTRNISADLSIENLLDQNYEIAEGFPEPGRSMFGSVSLRF